MADNFAFTPGAGASGAAEDIGGVLYQFVKLVSGVHEATDPIDGDGNGQLLVNPFGVANGWKYVHNIAAADGVHTHIEAKPAPGAGLSLYITDIIISNLSTAAMTFIFDEDGGGASDAQVIGTLYVPVSLAPIHIKFATAIKLTANLSLEWSNTGQSNASLTICGFTAA
jgi:hypothetical protein